MTIKSELPVNIPDTSAKSYIIHIGNDILKETGNLLSKLKLSGKVLILTDHTVHRLYGDKVIASLKKSGFSVRIQKINDGEAYKTLETVSKVYSILLEDQYERSSTILALGGGVIGDLAGFIAGTYQRGINFVQVPTTLLAQVDSSVGGKTGVNHPLGKNMVGVFYQPKVVIADTDTLKSLPEKEFRSGLAEVIKYGLILDHDFFNYLLKTTPADIDLNKVVYRCCSLKAKIVEKDEKEQNLRAILNFGHTVGHALETITKYTKYTHGEAVALGMLSAVYLSIKQGYLPEETLITLKAMYEKFKLPTKIETEVSSKAVLKIMYRDKKVSSGVIKMVLLKQLGNAVVEKIEDENLLLEAINILFTEEK